MSTTRSPAGLWPILNRVCARGCSRGRPKPPKPPAQLPRDRPRPRPGSAIKRTASHPAQKPGRQNSQIRKRQVLQHRNALKSGGKNTGLLAGCPFQPAQPPPADTPQISGPLRPQKAATGMIRTAFDQGVELSAASSEFCAGVQKYPGTSSFFASSRYFTSSSTSVRGSRHDAVKDPSRPQAPN